jgi:hypothetical protein
MTEPRPGTSGDEQPSANPDPDPSETTGLEPGGGVPPGETPPDSGSVNPGTPEAGPGRRTAVPWIVVGVALLIVLSLMALTGGRIADLLD